jgi:hypothetical protein
MAELSTPADTTANSCCAPEQQATCCEPSAKAECCDHENSSCGCAAGATDIASTTPRLARAQQALNSREPQLAKVRLKCL